MNRDFAILTEASCDLPPERIKAQDILVVAIPISIDSVPYRHNPSGEGISFSDFYKHAFNKVLSAESGIYSKYQDRLYSVEDIFYKRNRS